MTTPAAYRGFPHASTFSPDFPALGVRLFQLTGNVYACYIIPIALRTSWRFASLSRQPLSMGLRIIAIALGGKCVGAAERTTAIIATWIHHPLPGYINSITSTILWTSIVVFPIGVIYPSLAGRVLAVQRWCNHQRAYRRLEALWTILYQAYPQTALHRVPHSKVRQLLSWQSIHRRYYRRAIECRDGLVYISRYLPRPSHSGEAPRTADQWARELRAALTASANDSPSKGEAMLVAEPAKPDLDADVAELVALSQALADLDKHSQSRSR